MLFWFDSKGFVLEISTKIVNLALIATLSTNMLPGQAETGRTNGNSPR